MSDSDRREPSSPGILMAWLLNLARGPRLCRAFEEFQQETRGIALEFEGLMGAEQHVGRGGAARRETGCPRGGCRRCLCEK